MSICFNMKFGASNKIFRVIIILFDICYFTEALKKLDWHKVYQVQPVTEFQRKFLLSFVHNKGFDVLTASRHVNQTGNVLVSPDQQLYFEKQLQAHDIPYRVPVTNVTKYMLENDILHQAPLNKYILSRKKIDFNKYYRMADIYEYMNFLAKKYPAFVEVEELGKSYEGRSIRTIGQRIGQRSKERKKIIFIDAGIHAREWMAPAAALYIMHTLVENMRKSAQYLGHLHFLILPLVNPDGYEYTHTSERMWRKTRSKQDHGCYGVDANRNFDYHFDLIGSSDDPCNIMYHGPKPFSEIETKNVADIMLEISDRALMYLTLHAFGGYLMYPWGYNKSFLPENWREMHAVAKAGADEAERVHQTIYKLGSSSKILYPTAGCSHDYALGVANIPISLVMELEDYRYGFDPPPTKIKSLVEKSWTCIEGMLKYIIKKSRGKNSKERLMETNWALTLPLFEHFLCTLELL